MAEHAEELFERLDKGAHIYFCGLKGMMPGILATLQAWDTYGFTVHMPCAYHVAHAMHVYVPCTHYPHTMRLPLQAVAEAKGLSWETQLETLKKNGQWHVEVY